MGMDWQLVDGLNRPPPGVDDVWHPAINGKTLVQPNRCNTPTPLTKLRFVTVSWAVRLNTKSITNCLV